MLKFEVKGFREATQKLNQDIHRDKTKFVDVNMEILKTKLTLNTPIDTGYARSRWVYDKEILLRVSFKLSNKYFIKFTDEVYTVTNDAPYIEYLNRGSSKQAPAFFIEKTLLSQGYTPIKL